MIFSGAATSTIRRTISSNTFGANVSIFKLISTACGCCVVEFIPLQGCSSSDVILCRSYNILPSAAILAFRADEASCQRTISMGNKVSTSSRRNEISNHCLGVALGATMARSISERSSASPLAREPKRTTRSISGQADSRLIRCSCNFSGIPLILMFNLSYPDL